MAEKNDWTKLSKKELLEMLQRQEKLLANKKLLQSLPDKGRKVSETVEQLKRLIAQKERIEDTVAQFERLTVSQLVQRTQLDAIDSDDSDNNDDDKMLTQSCQDDPASSEQFKEITSKERRNTSGVDKSRNKKFTSHSPSRTWDYDSSATPPTYKLEKAKPLSLEESFKLLQDQEKRQKDLQSQLASQKLKEQSILFDQTDYTTVQGSNHLQYPFIIIQCTLANNITPNSF